MMLARVYATIDREQWRTITLNAEHVSMAIYLMNVYVS